MENPTVAARKPMTVDLEVGDKYWCSCGKSANQPWCDGAHKGSWFTPIKMTIEEPKKAAMCLCKRTKNPGYCDGAHAKLPKDTELPATSSPAADTGATAEEPTLTLIHKLAREGLSKDGHHGAMGAMGVSFPTLPRWEDIQLLAAQLATKPLMDDVEVGTQCVIGPNAKKPLVLEIPLFVSDMSFGALSEEAKTALARGAENAGTGICSGEGGMLPEEQAACSRYLYELGSAKFGYREELLDNVRPSTSRPDRVRRRVQAVTFPETKFQPRSPTCVASMRARRPCHHRPSSTWSRPKTLRDLATAYAT